MEAVINMKRTMSVHKEAPKLFPLVIFARATLIAVRKIGDVYDKPATLLLDWH